MAFLFFFFPHVPELPARSLLLPPILPDCLFSERSLCVNRFAGRPVPPCISLSAVPWDGFLYRRCWFSTFTLGLTSRPWCGWGFLPVFGMRSSDPFLFLFSRFSWYVFGFFLQVGWRRGFLSGFDYHWRFQLTPIQSFFPSLGAPFGRARMEPSFSDTGVVPLRTTRASSLGLPFRRFRSLAVINPALDRPLGSAFWVISLDPSF